MENTKFYIKIRNNLEELDIDKLCSRKYLYYYNIFTSIKIEFIKAKQVLPKYIVFEETLLPTRLLVYIYRNDISFEDIINYPLSYFSLKEGLDNMALANKRDDFTVKFYLL